MLPKRGLSVGPSVRTSSAALVHSAEAVVRNDMPFGRDTLVVPLNIVLDRGLGPPTERGDLGDGTLSSQRCRLSPNYFDLCSQVLQHLAKTNATLHCCHLYDEPFSSCFPFVWFR